MTTNVTSLVPSLDSSSRITSITITGDSDRPRIDLHITSPSNPGFVPTAQTFPDAMNGTGSVTLTGSMPPDDSGDFFVGEVNCDDLVDIDIFWLNNNAWVREDNYPIDKDVDCDQCSISITRLEGIPLPTSGMQEVIVHGTARVCSRVTVSVFDPPHGTPPVVSCPVINQEWEAHLVSGALGVDTKLKGFSCGEDHLVRVECDGDSDCPQVEVTLPLICREEVCPVDSVTLFIADPPGIPVPIDCVPTGRYIIQANIVPTTAPINPMLDFEWWVDDQHAVVTELGVEEIVGNRLTIHIDTTSRNIFVIVAGCRRNNPELNLVSCTEEDCCPTLDGLTANCMTRSPESRFVTFTATGENLVCAEDFLWEFGDGESTHTDAPSVNYTYRELSRFEASVTITRPERCGPPRSQQSSVIVNVCSEDSSSCDSLLWIAIIAILAGAALIIIACIMDPWPSPWHEIAFWTNVFGWALFVIGWVLFIAWWIVCWRFTACKVILDVRDLVGWLIGIFGIVTVIIGAVASLSFLAETNPALGVLAYLWVCCGLSFGAIANWGFIYWIINGIAEVRGCLTRNPG